MQSIGLMAPCDSWILPNNMTYFRNITLGYDFAGVTYIQAITNNGVLFERGTLKKTDSVT
jgi:hypothetical protein